MAAPKKAAKQGTEFVLTFEFERETKRTYRFAEVSAHEPVVGTLYIQQSAFNGVKVGEGTTLTVTITV